LLNGQALEGNIVPICKAGSLNHVRVIMG
jgi:hypothetical protein